MKDFDKLFDLEGLKKDISEASSNEYQDVPTGDYEVRIEKMELKESSKGDPMVSIWFKIVAGQFKDSIIFYNQVITKGFQIHINNDLLASFDSGLEIKFESYAAYDQLLSDIHIAVDGKYEYLLNYGQTAKGFKTYKITDKFTLAQN